MASGRNHVGNRHSKQPEHSPSIAAAVISNANVANAASKAGKSSKSCLSGGTDTVTNATAEELLEQCKCPISLELMRRPVLPSSGGDSWQCTMRTLALHNVVDDSTCCFQAKLLMRLI